MVGMIAFILCLLTTTAFGQYRYLYQDTIYIGGGWTEAGNLAAQEKYSDLPWWARQEAYYKWQFENRFEDWLDDNLRALKLRLQRLGNWPLDCDCCPDPAPSRPREISNLRTEWSTGNISADTSNPYWKNLDYAYCSEHFDTLIMKFRIVSSTRHMQFWGYGHWERFIGELVATVPRGLYELFEISSRRCVRRLIWKATGPVTASRRRRLIVFTRKRGSRGECG